MYNNDWEELSNVLEENRNLTVAIENLKSQKGQWESEVKIMEIIFCTLFGAVRK